MDAVSDAGFRHRIVLVLEGASHVDEDVELLRGKNAIEVAPPVEREAGHAQFGGHRLDLRAIARADRQIDERIVGQQAA